MDVRILVFATLLSSSIVSAGTPVIISVDPELVISGTEDDAPWYIFGYGSLLSRSSRIKSTCGLKGEQEEYIEWSLKNLNVDVVYNAEKAKCIREKQAKQYVPAEIPGYRRGWYAKGTLPQEGLPQNDLFIRPTFLGIIKDRNYSATGLLYSVTKEDLAKTDEREKRDERLYDTLTKNNLTFYSDVDIPDNAKIRVYASTTDLFDLPTKRFPIVQSYIDIFLGGAIEIEEDNPEIQNFALNTCKQTYGWVGGWVNDRPYPKYRATYVSTRAGKIDALLYDCMQENEAAMNVQNTTPELGPEYLPLTSDAIDRITFPGGVDEKDLNIHS